MLYIAFAQTVLSHSGYKINVIDDIRGKQGENVGKWCYFR